MWCGKEGELFFEIAMGGESKRMDDVGQPRWHGHWNSAYMLNDVYKCIEVEQEIGGRVVRKWGSL